MIETVTLYDFRDRFQSVRPDNFTYEGLEALFDYFESMETDEDQIQLDVIAICSEYSEWATFAEFCENYGEDYADLDEVENHTTVIKIGDSEAFIVLDF